MDTIQRTLYILDDHYEKSYLHKFVSESKHFTEQERTTFHNLWTKYEFLFEVTVGTWKNKPLYIELKLDDKPYNKKPYPVPRENKFVFKKKV